MRPFFIQTVVSRCLLLVAALLIAACGGGNSGGTSLTYTGATTAAVIDFDNGADLATGAYINGKSGGILGNALSVQQIANNDHPPRTVLLAKLLDSITESMQPVPSAADGLTAVTFGNNRDGRCGGIRTYNIEADPLTGEISGTARFRGYCEDDVSITGFLHITGTYDTLTKKLTTITLSIESLLITTPNDLFTVQGSMNFDRSVSPLTIRMDILVKDGISGDVFRDKDYVITIDTGNDPGFGDYVEVTISGRFYSPRTGYVDINTTIPIRTYLSERWPSICELTVKAVNKDGDEATATLSALSAKGYMVVINLGYASKTITANWEKL